MKHYKMRTYYYFLFAVAAALMTFIITRFGHFKDDGSSMWRMQMWLMPYFFCYLTVMFGFKVYLECKVGGWSGWVYKGLVPAWTTDNEKVRWWQASYFWMFVGSAFVGTASILGYIIFAK